MRYFIGIFLPDNLCNTLATLQEQIRPAFEGNLVAPKNLHVTVVFCGTVTDEDLGKLLSQLDSIKNPPFYLMLADIQAMKHIIWITVPSQELEDLHTRITTLLPDYSQKRAYTGHITLARVKSYHNKKILGSIEIPPLIWKVSSFGLYRSVTYQEGPQYTLIKEFLLRA